MNKVVVKILGNQDFRSSEIVADLRNVSEILYYPLKCVAFWDVETYGHVCPHLLSKDNCPHKLDTPSASLRAYRRTAETNLRSIVEIHFIHAGVYIYLR